MTSRNLKRDLTIFTIMKKDVIIAITVGFALGAATALLAVNFPTLVNTIKNQQVVNIPSITPLPSPLLKELTLKLNIEKPENESVVSTKNITISGKAEPSNVVYAVSDIDSNITEVSQNGIFSISLNISEGVNNIYVTADNEKGEDETKILTVFYTPEKL